jgi:hypothetical protein
MGSFENKVTLVTDAAQGVAKQIVADGGTAIHLPGWELPSSSGTPPACGGERRI